MTQPILPDEVQFTEIEAAYIEEQPPGLWPINQDSNFGIHRKIFCDQLTDAANQLDLIFNEYFISTSIQFLNLHEEELGVPISPANKTIEQRRAILLSRLKRGPFTRTLRKTIVESFITSTFGPAVQLTNLGVNLQNGVQLFSGVTSVDGSYQIIENVEQFSYDVQILTSITVDEEGLTRALERITPAGITFTISYVTTFGIPKYDSVFQYDQGLHYDV